MHVCMYVRVYDDDNDDADHGDDASDSISQNQLNDVNVNRSITITHDLAFG